MNSIQTLKANLLIIIGIIHTVDSSAEDKKISFVEWMNIFRKAISLYKVVKDFKTMMAEYQSMTPAQGDELTTYFAQEFDIRNDKVEEYIEQVLGVLVQISGLVITKQAIKAKA